MASIDYVFVDEHNRHKRLKGMSPIAPRLRLLTVPIAVLQPGTNLLGIVMRACEGCRRRKIKCDAATTNTWPCSACIRLKLHCVRPNGQYEGGADGFDAGEQEYEVAGMQDSFRQVPMAQQSSPSQQHQAAMMAGQPKPGMYAPHGHYADPQGIYYGDASPIQPGVAYPGMVTPGGGIDHGYPSAQVYHTPPTVASGITQSASPADSYQHDPYSQPDLSDLLGSLNVNEVGTGMCLAAFAGRQ